MSERFSKMENANFEQVRELLDITLFVGDFTTAWTDENSTTRLLVGSRSSRFKLALDMAHLSKAGSASLVEYEISKPSELEVKQQIMNEAKLVCGRVIGGISLEAYFEGCLATDLVLEQRFDYIKSRIETSSYYST